MDACIHATPRHGARACSPTRLLVLAAVVSSLAVLTNATDGLAELQLDLR
jgi:hypothetical protein